VAKADSADIAAIAALTADAADAAAPRSTSWAASPAKTITAIDRDDGATADIAGCADADRAHITTRAVTTIGAAALPAGIATIPTVAAGTADIVVSTIDIADIAAVAAGAAGASYST